MSYKVEKHADLPAVIVTLNADYDLLNEIEYSNKESIEILSNSDELLYLIIVFDVRLDFPSIMAGTQNVTRSDNALFLHPKVKQVCFVTEDKAIELTSKGYASPAFGSLNVGLFKSLDEVYVYISEQ